MALMISQLCSMISLEVGFRSVDYFYDFLGKRIDFLFHSDHHAYWIHVCSFFVLLLPHIFISLTCLLYNLFTLAVND